MKKTESFSQKIGYFDPEELYVLKTIAKGKTHNSKSYNQSNYIGKKCTFFVKKKPYGKN